LTRNKGIEHRANLEQPGRWSIRQARLRLRRKRIKDQGKSAHTPSADHRFGKGRTPDFESEGHRGQARAQRSISADPPGRSDPGEGRGKPAAQALMKFLKGDRARAIIISFGYEL